MMQAMALYHKIGWTVHLQVLKLIVTQPSTIIPIFAPSLLLKALALCLMYNVAGGMGMFVLFLVLFDMFISTIQTYNFTATKAITAN